MPSFDLGDLIRSVINKGQRRRVGYASVWSGLPQPTYGISQGVLSGIIPVEDACPFGNVIKIEQRE